MVTRRAVSVYIIIRLYKYLGMMGLSVGVNTHSHIKKGVRLLPHAPEFSGSYRTDRGNEYECFNLPISCSGALSIDCAKSSIVPLRSFKRPTLNAAVYNVCWYTLCWFNAAAVPLRSFKHYLHCYGRGCLTL